VRFNRDGKLYTLNYNRVGHHEIVRTSSLPLFHYLPATQWLQVGLKGCDMRCPFCNTYQWSQLGAARVLPMTASQLVGEAMQAGVAGISFGVSEPAVAHEFVSDVFDVARRSGLRTHLATNGEWSEEPFHDMLSFVDALTFGFKGFDSEWLMHTCGGHLEIVQSNVASAIAAENHVEIAYLLVDSLPDWHQQLAKFVDWLDTFQKDVPVILLPLKTSFMWEGPPTSSKSIMLALAYLRQRLPFVYYPEMIEGVGDTRCPKCDRVLLRRVEEETLVDSACHEGVCPNCGDPLPFIL
jgi:pyruvate formate lyase activating enzyme